MKKTVKILFLIFSISTLGGDFGFKNSEDLPLVLLQNPEVVKEYSTVQEIEVVSLDDQEVILRENIQLNSKEVVKKVNLRATNLLDRRRFTNNFNDDFDEDECFPEFEDCDGEDDQLPGEDCDPDFEECEEPGEDLNNIEKGIRTIERVISLGEKIVHIIKSGRPVYDVTMSPGISVIPDIENPVSAFLKMENWSDPKAKKYQVRYKNLYGVVVVRFDFTVYFQHSGNIDGVGKYISGLKVAATNINNAWGFNLDATSRLSSVANQGSLEEPLASAIFELDYEARGIAQRIHKTLIFHVKGDGSITQI